MSIINCSKLFLPLQFYCIYFWQTDSNSGAVRVESNILLFINWGFDTLKMFIDIYIHILYTLYCTLLSLPLQNDSLMGVASIFFVNSWSPTSENIKPCKKGLHIRTTLDPSPFSLQHGWKFLLVMAHKKKPPWVVNRVCSALSVTSDLFLLDNVWEFYILQRKSRWNVKNR